MLKFLGGGATFIQGATSIPDSRVVNLLCWFVLIPQIVGTLVPKDPVTEKVSLRH